jgi:tripartite-type tricarboxylate transporter receptor subunit TctC
MEIVAKAPADGYTLFSGPGSSITTNPHMQDKMPIDVLRDLAPVSPMGQFSAVLVVHPSPYGSVWIRRGARWACRLQQSQRL